MGIFISDKRYLDLLCELKITPNQFIQLYWIYTRNWSQAVRFAEEVREKIAPGIREVLNKEADDLVNRGYLLDMNKPGEYYVDCYAVSDGVATRLFVDIDQAGQELWEAFPDYIVVDTRQMPTKSVDFDNLISKYADNIANNPVKHRRVLELVEKAERAGMITMGIDKWVRSRQWESLEKVFGKKDEQDKYGEREV